MLLLKFTGNSVCTNFLWTIIVSDDVNFFKKFIRLKMTVTITERVIGTDFKQYYIKIKTHS